MLSIKQEMKAIIEELKASNAVDAAAIIRRDGILLASNFPQLSLPKEIFAMMSATILGAAKNITLKSAMGKPLRVVIETNDGNLIIAGAGTKALLICLVKDSLAVHELQESIDNVVIKVQDLM